MLLNILKRNTVLVLFLITLSLTGCSGQSISLEAALSEAGRKEQTEQASERQDSAQQAVPVCVYVCGEVVVPGVYELESGSRIAAAVEAAGGFTEAAAREAVNLASQIEDGMQIRIPSEEEISEARLYQEKQALGLVNLNTATAEELCTLSGIGQAKAEAILAYRTELGCFHSVEQLKEVAGIGESLFNKIKDNVYIE